MKRIPLWALSSILFFAAPCIAEDSYQHARGALMTTPQNGGEAMVLDTDGNLSPGEYEVISPNGSITRALCPYTCERRGIPATRCLAWRSASDPSRCYVQDTAIPSNAIPFGGSANRK